MKKCLEVLVAAGSPCVCSSFASLNRFLEVSRFYLKGPVDYQKTIFSKIRKKKWCLLLFFNKKFYVGKSVVAGDYLCVRVVQQEIHLQYFVEFKPLN